MRRFALPNLNIVLALVLSGATLSSFTYAGGKTNRMRVDCRFYPNSSHFCYSSAVYTVTNGDVIDDIRFGVGCDYETIYDDGATANPQEEVSDGIRPRNAAIPKVEITPKGSLRRPGTYTAKLESDHGRINDGTCYVRKVDESEGDYHLFAQDWFFFQ